MKASLFVWVCLAAGLVPAAGAQGAPAGKPKPVGVQAAVHQTPVTSPVAVVTPSTGATGRLVTVPQSVAPVDSSPRPTLRAGSVTPMPVPASSPRQAAKAPAGQRAARGSPPKP